MRCKALTTTLSPFRTLRSNLTMSSSLSVVRMTVLLVAISTTVSYAASTPAESAAATSEAAYPLKTCVVSGGKLGGMGKPVEYIHRQAGQPDSTVIFSCRACIEKFEKDPAKFLAKLDAAWTTAPTANQR